MRSSPTSWSDRGRMVYRLVNGNKSARTHSSGNPFMKHWVSRAFGGRSTLCLLLDQNDAPKIVPPGLDAVLVWTSGCTVVQTTTRQFASTDSTQTSSGSQRLSNAVSHVNAGDEFWLLKLSGLQLPSTGPVRSVSLRQLRLRSLSLREFPGAGSVKRSLLPRTSPLRQPLPRTSSTIKASHGQAVNQVHPDAPKDSAPRLRVLACVRRRCGARMDRLGRVNASFAHSRV